MLKSLFNFILAFALATHSGAFSRLQSGHETKEKFYNKKEIVLSEDSIKIWNKWINETISKSDSLGCPAIIVSKLDKRLSLYINGKYDTSFEISLFNYTRPKTKMGDGLTPEGMFYVTKMAPHKFFGYIIQISYPDTIAAKIGLENKLITKKEYTEIEKAIREKRTPPMHTKLGGDICIHGTKASIGCIAIDSGIYYLYEKVKNKKVLVTIVRGTKPKYLID